MIDANHFKNKKVLVTGHTGFKGSWLCVWLARLGAKVFGVSDQIYSGFSHFDASSVNTVMSGSTLCDIRNYHEFEEVFDSVKPDFVFHLAAQALVVKSYDDPITTFSTNIIGTMNVLYKLSQRPGVIGVLITSDKVYQNNEWVWGYRENDLLGGLDPYSASKAMTELGIRSMFHSYFASDCRTRVAIARAGNVIGGGDWAEHRIVPDAVRAWSNGMAVKIRKPNSTRPWQHVLEPIGGYLALANALANSSLPEKCPAFNFGPDPSQNFSVIELLNSLSQSWQGVADIEIIDEQLAPESGLLRLNCDKAKADLNWSAKLTFEECVNLTSDWYQKHLRGEDNMLKVTSEQIELYADKIG